jgi:VanZ family protein
VIVLAARNVLFAGLAAVVYAAFDEATQSIPGLGRTAAWDDFAANAAGIVVAVVASLLIGLVLGPILKGRGS